MDTGEHPSVAQRMNICGLLRFDREGRAQVLPVWGASLTSVEAALAPVREQIATAAIGPPSGAILDARA